MFTFARALLMVGMLAWSSALAAQEFPNRTIKFVVPFPAGGPSDTISRVLTEKMASLLGQSVVIENHAGAGGLNGIASVAKSSPDGYTIAIAPSSKLAMNVNLRDSMPFHPLKDLALITQIVSVPEILVVNENVPAKTLAEFIALAKAQPGKLVFASTGHRRHAAYGHGAARAHGRHPACPRALHRRGARRERPARRPCPDDVCGRAGAARQHPGGQAARAGDRQPHAHRQPAVAGDDGRTRHAAGRGRQLVWAGGAGRDAAPILAKLYSAAAEALHSAEVKDKLAAQGAIAVGNSSAEFSAYVKSEIERWGKVIAATGIKIK